ncbi:hypothetical protein DASC09_062810 [Saccharomycopsis crataegensis]|uniref:LIM zinc-binding domain-containing protein n=1 Tax=Saccharomycopsis crataegensis TaxID=43959 RepID=A0AAV5QWK7_9ASCO|nr:hypothetical protein DASC09_062810 [Saccharomycopsis crataegensis]
MNLFNKKVRKASEQLTIPSMPSIRRKDKDYKCFYCKGDINKDSDYRQESNGVNLYHTKCLTCHQCKHDCSSEFYITFKKINRHYLPMIYCKRDMNEVCHACGESIEKGGLVTYLENKYHEEHFRCSECLKILSLDGQVFELKRKLYCSKHFIVEYRKEKVNQETFLQNKEIRKSRIHSDLYHGFSLDYYMEDDDDDEDSEGYGEEDAEFHHDNLDIRDFSKNDYSTKYCGGCNTMLLAGSNIKDVRFYNSDKREYWHLDCLTLFKKYKVILSPKFVDPRRFIMFNKNASSINLNAVLRNISQKLDLYFEKLESEFNFIGVNINNRDKVGLFQNFNNLLSQIQLLFNATQDIFFVIEDHYTAIRRYKFTEAESENGSGNSLEKINFTRYTTLKEKHTRIHSLFADLLRTSISDYEMQEFGTKLVKTIDYVIAFVLHKILVYNYLTKENHLLQLFLDKLNSEIVVMDTHTEAENSMEENREILKEYISQEPPVNTDFLNFDQETNASLLSVNRSINVNDKSGALEESSIPDTTTENTIDKPLNKDNNNDKNTNNILLANTGDQVSDFDSIDKTVIPEDFEIQLNGRTPLHARDDNDFSDPVCSKCQQEIKLESFIFQISGEGESQKIFRFHMNCVEPQDFMGAMDVPNIIDAYGSADIDGAEKMSSSKTQIEYVSVYDQTIDSTKRLLKSWFSKQLTKQPPSPVIYN